MALYAADSGEATVDNTAEVSLATTTDWVVASFKIAGAALGDNHLLVGRGSVGMLVEAGDVVGPLLIPPATQVRVKTTSSVAVKWGYQITTLPGALALQNLAFMTAYLNAMACAIAGPEVMAAVDATVRKELGL